MRGGGATGAQSAPPARLSSDSSVSVTSSVDVSSATLISVQSRVESTSGELDSSCVIHLFHVHKMDSGPVRLMTIAHAFNYRVAVLRDGVRSALRVGRSRKAEKCFLTNGNISWGQQVAVMFQIVSMLMEEVPVFALRTRQSEMANTSPATCQCLATFIPLKSKMLIFFRDVISLLARVIILLIDTATQEVPMKNI